MKMAISVNCCTTICVLVLMVYSYKNVLKDLALDLVVTFSFEGMLYFVHNFG